MSTLLDVLDAAVILNLNGREVRALVRNGLLPHVALPNGEIRFDPDDLRWWVESLKQPATAATLVSCAEVTP